MALWGWEPSTAILPERAQLVVGRFGRQSASREERHAKSTSCHSLCEKEQRLRGWLQLQPGHSGRRGGLRCLRRAAHNTGGRSRARSDQRQKARPNIELFEDARAVQRHAHLRRGISLISDFNGQWQTIPGATRASRARQVKGRDFMDRCRLVTVGEEAIDEGLQSGVDRHPTALPSCRLVATSADL